MVIRDYINPATNMSSTVEIAPAFPAVPNQRLCSCMVERLNCVVPADVDMSTDKMRGAVASICSTNPLFCQAVQGNSTTGIYGAFLGCSLVEVGSWIFTKAVENKGNDSAICKSLSGNTQIPTSISSQDSDCQSLLHQARPDGMGTVTFTPEAKSAVKNNRTSGSKISTPAAVGAGVGIFLGLILISVLILVLRVRRRLSRAKKKDLQELGKPELEDTSNTVQAKGVANKDDLGGGESLSRGDGSQRQELDANGPIEIDATGKLVEIGGEGELYELPSGNERVELPTRNDKPELSAGDDDVVTELPTGDEKAELPTGDDKAEVSARDEKAELSRRDNLGL